VRGDMNVTILIIYCWILLGLPVGCVVSVP